MSTATSILTAGVDYVGFNGALGTPSSGTLTSCTGLPVSTGVSGLGTGVATAAAIAANASSGIVVSNSSGDINAGRRITVAGDTTAYLSSPFAGAIAVTNPTTTFWFVSSLVQINSDSGGFGFGVSTDAYVKRAATAVVGIEGSSSVGGTMRFPAKTASQITGNQNDYNPGGRSYFQRWSTDSSHNVTGLVFASAGVDGEEHEIWNVGTTNIVLVNESASSTAANRFTNTTGADITLAANQMAKLTYDGTTSRWRVKP